MATRSIITSQPDVACDVCERRLLRGEQPDIFLAAGQRRIVCELCAPRAMHEGWRREADGESVTLSPLRPRRGRNLFERLRGVGRPASAPAEPDVGGLAYEPDPAHFEQVVETSRGEPEPFDFLGGLEIVEDRPAATDDPEPEDNSRSMARSTAGATPAERGVEIFNASEFPRRIAGIARSLGAPAVNVGQVEDTVGETVAIVVAWELCWYRYEVDLDVQAPAARLAAQGTELEELPRGERLANALIDELGLLAPSPA